jgi:hypothetical protein
MHSMSMLLCATDCFAGATTVAATHAGAVVFSFAGFIRFEAATVGQLHRAPARPFYWLHLNRRARKTSLQMVRGDRRNLG